MNKSIWAPNNRYKLFIHLFFILFCLLFILPFFMVISISFSSEELITSTNGGYSILPRGFTLEAYKMAFKDPQQIVDGYIVTTFTAVAGTLITLLSAGMTGYVLSRSNFAYKGIITFLVFFTMLFSGGTIPTYVIYAKYYHLKNTIWIYLLPCLAGGAWNILMIRTFCKGIPESLFEAAKIDGANELRIFFQIAVPLSKPVLASVGFVCLLGKWNDWQTSLVYIDDAKLYTLQYYLQRILNEAEYIKELINSGLMVSEDFLASMNTPTETLKYAMCIIATGPMLAVFPFFQKYFEKGMVVGAVKG